MQVANCIQMMSGLREVILILMKRITLLSRVVEVMLVKIIDEERERCMYMIEEDNGSDYCLVIFAKDQMTWRNIVITKANHDAQTTKKKAI